MNEDETIMRFMAKLPSPTYEFAWFTDWFGVYIRQIKNSLIKEEDKKKVQEKFEEYNSNLVLFESELMEYHNQCLGINEL